MPAPTPDRAVARRAAPAAALLAAVLLASACNDGADPAAPGPPLPPDWLAGRVIDDTGAPLPGIRVADPSGFPSAVTGADGAFRLGPFAAGDTVVLVTESRDTVSAPGADDAWYDCTTPVPPAARAAPVAITLLTRYACALDGGGDLWPENDHFSHFLEYSTSPFGSPTGPSVCWGWPVPFPLPVHVRDSVIVHADAGDTVRIDAGACVRAALARWNEAAGRDLLAEVAEPASARVTTSYPALGITRVAEVKATDPDGCGFRTCAPVTVDVGLSSVHIPDAPRFTEIAVHEFGHALGFWGHVNEARRILDGGVPVRTRMGTQGGVLASPIHPLEVKAIVAHAHVPCGTPLERYEGTAPWFADFPPLPAADPDAEAAR